MNNTYRAMQVASSGLLELVERPTPVPGIGEVLIEVEACGICGADVSDIERAQPSRVPGHEVVGRIVAIGGHVSPSWQIGQRVGVGRMGGHCNQCVQCRQGRFQLCEDQPYTGATSDGGYAEMMVARSTGLVSIPDELSAEEAAPILCAGIATFNALRKCEALPGDIVAIAGIGGLGHMALQYARRMGFKVVAIGRGSDIAEDALALGAHVYIDNEREDTVAVLKAMGGAQAMVTMINDGESVSALIGGLSPHGRLVLLNPSSELSVSASPLVVGERSIVGSITGTPYDNERALNFSVLVDARPQIEVMPLEQANNAFQRMKSGEVRFRMVLVMRKAGSKAISLG